MQIKICKVIAQTGVEYVNSGNGQLAKCLIRLRELGSDFEDEYQYTMLGNLAQCRFDVGKTVVAVLRFSTHENNGKVYQDITVKEMIKM